MVPTLLDLEATTGEVEVAARKATRDELHAVVEELNQRTPPTFWVQEDVAARLSYLRAALHEQSLREQAAYHY